MTTPFGATGVLERHRAVLTTALKAAVVAAPVLLSAAPSQAASVTKTFTGFTDVFAPANWTRVSGNQDSSAITLNRAATAGTSSATWTLTPAILANLITNRPSNAKPIFQGVEVSYNWSWVPSGNLTGTNNAFTFTFLNNGSTVGALPIGGVRTGGVSVSASSANPAGAVYGEGDSFQFSLSRSASPAASQFVSSTGTISNATFTAFYEEVPGPLPLAGAAAAFAWSRRLRRRLNSAESIS